VLEYDERMTRFFQVDALRVREMCMCLTARALARNLTNRYDEALAPIGLRMTQFSLLAHVRALGAPRVGELAEAMGLDQTTASRGLDVMRRYGLITVTHEGRNRIIELTGAGDAKLAAAYPLWRRAQAEATASVGGESAWLELKRTMHDAVPASSGVTNSRSPAKSSVRKSRPRA